MRKILSVVFILFMFNLPSFAVITTDEATSQDYIQNHGYSDEMSRLIDLQNAQVNGTATKYKGTDPDWYTSNKMVNAVRKVFMYFDCGLDDEKFMQHNTRFTPKWDDL